MEVSESEVGTHEIKHLKFMITGGYTVLHMHKFRSGGKVAVINNHSSGLERHKLRYLTSTCAMFLHRVFMQICAFVDLVVFLNVSFITAVKRLFTQLCATVWKRSSVKLNSCLKQDIGLCTNTMKQIHAWFMSLFTHGFVEHTHTQFPYESEIRLYLVHVYQLFWKASKVWKGTSFKLADRNDI